MANTKTGLLYYTSDTNRFKEDLRIKRLKKDMDAMDMPCTNTY